MRFLSRSFWLKWLPFRKPKEIPAADIKGNPQQEFLKCATANVLQEIRWGEGGVQIKRGTKHFRGGAKVYIIDFYPGTCDSVVVVGHHRASGRYIELSMRAKHLENFRITDVYSPKVLAVIKARYTKAWVQYSEERARMICAAAEEWAETERNRKKQDN